MPSTYDIVIGSIMGLSILLMFYLSIKGTSGRLSNILMTLGIVAEAVTVFSQTRPVSIGAGILGLALMGTSLILSIRSMYATGLFRRRV